MRGHEIILHDFLNAIQTESVATILDAGSGRTSLSAILAAFPGASVDAVVYPGDTRKIDSISSIEDPRKQIHIQETDICTTPITKKYDVIVAHLLLGEAAKFGNSFKDLLNKVAAMKYRYLIIIDYLEDPGVNEQAIPEMCKANRASVVYRSYFTNENPQVWEDFTGTHNFGYLIKK